MEKSYKMQQIGMLYWTALSVKFLPSYSELIKNPHSHQVGIFGVHNFFEIDGMGHTFLENPAHLVKTRTKVSIL